MNKVILFVFYCMRLSLTEDTGTQSIFLSAIWGSKAEIPEPESLWQEIRSEAERMLKIYQKEEGREERDDAFNLRG